MYIYTSVRVCVCVSGVRACVCTHVCVCVVFKYEPPDLLPHPQVNIIPVIAKADTMTPEECARFKKTVSSFSSQVSDSSPTLSLSPSLLPLSPLSSSLPLFPHSLSSYHVPLSLSLSPPPSLSLSVR